MTEKLSRKTHLKSLYYPLLGAFAMAQTLVSPVEVAAQTQPVIDPRPPSSIERPKAVPLLVPRPEARWVEPTDLDHIITSAALEMGLSEEQVRRIINCESEFDPTKENLVTGARGLWQIMPIHAEKFLKRGWNYWRDWSNPYRNTEVAVDIKEAQGLEAWDCK